MEKFIAKAFVEVSNVEKMRELYIDIKRCYGRPCDNTLYSPNGNVVVFNETETWTMFSKYPNTDHFIDCNHYANGDEDLAVKLFLELARVREDSDNRFKYADFPYFENGIGRTIERDQIIDTKKEKWSDFKCKELYTNLTPLELAEAVRDGKIKL